MLSADRDPPYSSRLHRGDDAVSLSEKTAFGGRVLAHFSLIVMTGAGFDSGL